MAEIQEQYQLLLDDKEALKEIRAKFGIDEPRFIIGLEYVGLTLDATMSKTKAYATAFKVPKETAAKVSSQFHRAKWVQELIAYLRPKDNSLYLSEIKRIIGTGMEIVNDPEASHRNKVDAMKALQPYIKAEKLAGQIPEGALMADTTGMTVVNQLAEKINILVQAGKMVNEQGDVVDVCLVQ